MTAEHAVATPSLDSVDALAKQAFGPDAVTSWDVYTDDERCADLIVAYEHDEHGESAKFHTLVACVLDSVASTAKAYAEATTKLHARIAAKTTTNGKAA